MPGVLRLLALLALVMSAFTACDTAAPRAAERTATSVEAASPPTSPAPEPQPLESVPSPLGPVDPQPSDGRPRQAQLTIAKLGIDQLTVVPYRGFTDDASGTGIQNGGLAASPHGPRGGVGAGGIGNYQVTAHRTSSTRAFEFLPALRIGDRVSVVAGGRRYLYRITATRSTSFRSARSLAQQRAPVPGHPGRPATRAMITLSTCATQEDHAVGNYWSDEFDNPEHRIDKIGVLIRSTRL